MDWDRIKGRWKHGPRVTWPRDTERSDPDFWSDQVVVKGVGVVQFGNVDRVVDGRLVYVSTSPDSTYAVRPDTFVIQSDDGSLRPYRGESFAELGLDVGRKVVVFSGEAKEPSAVVLKGSVRPSSGSSMSSELSEIGVKTLDFLKSKPTIL
jgi:hypothetical protein